MIATDKVSKIWNEDADKDNLDETIGVLQRLLWLTVPGDHTSPLKSAAEQFDLMAKVNAHLAATVQIGTFTAMMMSTAIDDDKKHEILDGLARCCLGTHEWKGAEGNGAKTRGDLATQTAAPPPDEPPKTIVPPRPAPLPKLTVPRLLREFIPKQQASALRSCLQGEEKQHFSDMLAGWVKKIQAMPLYYSTEKVPTDDKVVHLHYFSSSMDWYIVEMDPDAFTPDEDYPQGPGPNRVFGLSCMQVDEWGAISILEMCESEHVTFDEHWTAKTVKEIFTDKETAGEDTVACEFCGLDVAEAGSTLCDSCHPTEPTEECHDCRRVKATGAIIHCQTCSENLANEPYDPPVIHHATPDEAAVLRDNEDARKAAADAEAEEQAMDEALFPHTTAEEAAKEDHRKRTEREEAPDPYMQGQEDDIEAAINPAKDHRPDSSHKTEHVTRSYIDESLAAQNLWLKTLLVSHMEVLRDEIQEQTDELKQHIDVRLCAIEDELKCTIKNIKFEIKTKASD